MAVLYRFYCIKVALIVLSSFAIVLLRKGELVEFLLLGGCPSVSVSLPRAVSWAGLQSVILAFPGHTCLIFWHLSYMYMHEVCMLYSAEYEIYPAH